MQDGGKFSSKSPYLPRWEKRWQLIIEQNLNKATHLKYFDLACDILHRHFWYSWGLWAAVFLIFPGWCVWNAPQQQAQCTGGTESPHCRQAMTVHALGNCTEYQNVVTLISVYVLLTIKYLWQGRSQICQASTFCRMAPNLFVSSVCYVTILAPTILRWTSLVV